MTLRPDISIAVIAYNHERFIQDTFRGIALQQFSGTVEVVIGDDCSTDRTRKMATEFAAAHPNAKLLFHAKNGGMMYNWLTTINACSGRYIALCEGDDYWTDPLKLQKQVDFLEANETSVGCFHNSVTVNADSQVTCGSYYNPTFAETTFNRLQALTQLQHLYHTGSLVFRRSAIENMHQKWRRVLCDFVLDYVITEHGDLTYLNYNMSAYRIHSSGIWQGANDRDRIMMILNRYKAMYSLADEKHRDYIRREISDIYRKLMLHNPDRRRLQLELFAFLFTNLDFKNFHEIAIVTREWITNVYRHRFSYTL